jgi:hypothetical protein
MNSELSFFSSVNARNYTPEQVAKTFVVNDDFRLLCQNEHSILLGPRGCGKTTLFKMLTQRALYAWESDGANKTRADLPFIAVYIPTDIHWHHQIMHCLKHLPKDSGYSDLFSKAAVAANVFVAICKCMKDRLSFEISDADVRSESELSKRLMDLWKIQNPGPKCLDHVESCLKQRISDIQIYTNKISLMAQLDKIAEVELPEYLYLSYMQSAVVALSIFDDVYHTSVKKWALCFDELEIAPDWLQDQLFNEVRGSTQTVLLKLSASPIPSISNRSGGNSISDFGLIKMWPQKDNGYEQFMENLATAVLKRDLQRDVSPADVFGETEGMFAHKSGEDLYAADSWRMKIIRAAAEDDPTLKHFLTSKEINIDDPTETAELAKRDSVLRKVFPIAYQRHTFLKNVDGKLVRRSRKNPKIYSGRQAIYGVADGNPRRLIYIINDMLRYFDEKTCRVNSSDQNRVLQETSNRFTSFIKTMPFEQGYYMGKNYTLFDLIDRIALFFVNEIYSPEFHLDLPGTFRVDREYDERLCRLIQGALSCGAIVWEDESEEDLDSSLINKRFRLTYALAPYYGLLFRMGHAVNLARCLNSGKSENTGQLTMEYDDLI